MDKFTQAYMEAALWSTNDESTPEGGVPLDENYTVEDIAPETRNQMIRDARSFQRMHGELIEIDESHEIEKYGRWELAGHDFWLTRNRHGAGFEDGQWPRSGDALAKAARAFGEFDLYVGDDGLIHGSGGLPGLREKRTNARRYSVPKRPPYRHVAPRVRANQGTARGGRSRASSAMRASSAVTDDLVVLEYMPAYRASSHRSAGNFGSYPHNGAIRVIIDRETAEEIVAADEDEYAEIVRDATPSDRRNYGQVDYPVDL